MEGKSFQRTCRTMTLLIFISTQETEKDGPRVGEEEVAMVWTLGIWTPLMGMDLLLLHPSKKSGHLPDPHRGRKAEAAPETQQEQQQQWGVTLGYNRRRRTCSWVQVTSW
jgi:hypothetical protein